MQAKRLTLAAGVETAFEFDSFFSNSIIVKNMTGGAIQFCDGPFDAAKSAIIPAFGWQTFTVTIPYDAAPKFYVKATVAGDVEIDFGSSMVGGTFGAGVMQLSGSNVEVIDVVIAESETESAEVDVSKYKYFAILMPAAWTDATLTIKGSAVAGGTKQIIKNDVGQAFPTMTVAVDTLYAIDANALMLAALPYISLVSSVAQESARTIKLICKA